MAAHQTFRIALQVQPTAFTGVVVQEVVQFSDQFCTPASFSLPEAHPANYTGTLLIRLGWFRQADWCALFLLQLFICRCATMCFGSVVSRKRMLLQAPA